MNTIKNRREDRGGAGAWDGVINLMRSRHLAVAVSKASPLKKSRFGSLPLFLLFFHYD